MGENQRDFHEGFLKTSPFPLGYHGLGSLGTENPVSFFNHSRTREDSNRESQFITVIGMRSLE